MGTIGSLATRKLFERGYIPDDDAPIAQLYHAPVCEIAQYLVDPGARGTDRHRQLLLTDMVQRRRSEEHTSELQSLMRTSYAVFCLKTKNSHIDNQHIHIHIKTQ